MNNTIAGALVFLTITASLLGQACTPFRNVNHRMIIKGRINGKGPYSFLLDTGSQSTLIDSNLFKANHLINMGTVDVSGMGLHQSTGWTLLDSFEIDGHIASRFRVIIYDLTKSQGPEDARIYGIIGEDFLERFNLRIDNHKSCIELSE
jgi:aspartyl protease